MKSNITTKFTSVILATSDGMRLDQMATMDHEPENLLTFHAADCMLTFLCSKEDIERYEVESEHETPDPDEADPELLSEMIEWFRMSGGVHVVMVMTIPDDDLD